ncbi:glycoside hydrolase family 32 protein [Thermoactinomyces intermedius]|jgi:fructan beta-fructosidase|uniref:Glycoside hydrolase family 32 protein n=1 Tax=Thermoactinomyces intermedius TaxID=2024 RepID=A0A8I1AA69_THEIN|nr:glycoside hydrolase family 32 protein [Thermoactinomyces intermedius]MBA4549112.1 glycoside hydrolase family 32 protein [Thermoactinomyces intermedius]MBA4835673.1 glycoside hydrolase family 32 protein [Thermoactinomyces intermedius]MBH8595521.1 glycoside hydrolase family 32 protein [Thermoactinomyces intermedius]
MRPLSVLTFLLIASLLLVPWGTSKVQAGNTNETLYNEPYRPQYHFSPQKNWMNDPNGLVYYKGEYHLFYQYNPYGNKWGHLSWGHAVSKDLIHWKHLPVALKEDDLGMIFSGSVVVDKHDTSGFFDGKSGMVAIYTSAGETQQQSIAYSKDNGRTWHKYKGNPVIPNPGIKDFRDPKVFWYDETDQWVMVVAAGDRVQFYTSKNLKDWTFTSEFGADRGAHGGVWECPELFELPVKGNPGETKWVLQVDINPGAVAGGSGAQYFVGEFDGKKFTTEQKDVKWVDYGKDFYATQSWNNTPDRRIWLAWMNNWQYAQDIPTSPWRSAMSIPREVSLKKEDGEYVLLQEPVRELSQLRKNIHTWKNQWITPKTNLLSDIKGETLEIQAEFQLDTAKEFGFKVRKGSEEETVIGYNTDNKTLFVDRTKSGQTDFSEHFPGVYQAKMEPENNTVQLRILVDRSSVEVFGNDGETVLTNRIFPNLKSQGLELFTEGGNVKLKTLKIYHLKSTWK